MQQLAKHRNSLWHLVINEAIMLYTVFLLNQTVRFSFNLHTFLFYSFLFNICSVIFYSLNNISHILSHFLYPYDRPFYIITHLIIFLSTFLISPLLFNFFLSYTFGLRSGEVNKLKKRIYYNKSYNIMLHGLNLFW